MTENLETSFSSKHIVLVKGLHKVIAKMANYKLTFNNVLNENCHHLGIALRSVFARIPLGNKAVNWELVGLCGVHTYK